MITGKRKLARRKVLVAAEVRESAACAAFVWPLVSRRKLSHFANRVLLVLGELPKINFYSLGRDFVDDCDLATGQSLS